MECVKVDTKMQLRIAELLTSKSIVTETLIKHLLNLVLLLCNFNTQTFELIT